VDLLKDPNKTASNKIKEAVKDLVKTKKLIANLEFSAHVDEGKQNEFSKELDEFTNLMSKFIELEKSGDTELPLKEALASLIEAAKNAILDKYGMMNSLLLDQKEGVLPDEVKNDEFFKSAVPVAMNDTLKAEYKEKNVERVGNPDAIKDDKIKAAVLAALAKAQAFMDKLKAIKEKITVGQVLSAPNIQLLKGCADMGIDLDGFLGASLGDIVSDQEQRLLDLAKGIPSPITKVQSDEMTKKSETKVDGEKKVIKPVVEKPAADMAKDIAEERDSWAKMPLEKRGQTDKQ
jgi:hypothetical protein